MVRNVNRLSQSQLSSFDGTLEVHLVEVITDVCGLLEHGDQAVLDGNIDFGALGNGALERADRVNNQRLATVEMLVWLPRR